MQTIFKNVLSVLAVGAVLSSVAAAEQKAPGNKAKAAGAPACCMKPGMASMSKVAAADKKAEGTPSCCMKPAMASFTKDKKAGGPVCSVCKMKLSTKKTKMATVPVKIKGKTYYCCAGCGAHKTSKMMKKPMPDHKTS